MKTNYCLRLVAITLLLMAGWSGPAAPVAQDTPGASHVLGDCLVLEPLGTGVRSLVFTDPVEEQYVRGTLVPPKAGDELRGAGKAAKWTAAKADAAGALQHDALKGGYCWWNVTLPRAGTFLLHAAGHVSVYVNGEPRVGDVYGMGIVHLPVRLTAGENRLLFRCARGRLNARIDPAAEGIQVFEHDSTLPDILTGPAREYWAAVLLANITDKSCHVRVSATVDGGEFSAAEVRMAPYSVRKAAITFKMPAIAEQKELRLKVSAGRVTADAPGRRADEPESTREFKLAVRGPRQNHKVTFRSGIDGSVQYYAVNPARPVSDDQPLGIVLSCHGASVEATNQAAAYSEKSWCHIVCPTNRRHYGFDWEDWGRQDAIEVLEHAKATLKHDPSMVYLTGHSMGGHGAWQLAAHHPDRFAAVGPSAGWCSFWSYGGKQQAADDAMSTLLRRSENGSDTMLLKQNYAQMGVYILHGDADDNVPVSEARFMRDGLKDFHADLHYHEEPGVGHWWDRGDNKGDKGADCVDWQPMFDLFARRRIPAPGQVREIDFTTVSPGISAGCNWATIDQQQAPFATSRIQLRCAPNMRRVSGATHNVRQLALHVGAAMASGDIAIELDGEKLGTPWPADGIVRLRRDEKWSVAAFTEGARSPARGGGFRSAFHNDCVIVHGTGGSEAERRWAAAKARFDAEQFWYRGNGSIEIMPDTEFDAAANHSRNVILVGSPETNSAYKAMKIDSPVRVAGGKVFVGDKELSSDMALLAVVPKPGSHTASVGLICGSNLCGMRLINRIPYLAPGIGVPDFVVFDAKMLRDGIDGVRAAGYFDNDWRLYESDIVIR